LARRSEPKRERCAQHTECSLANGHTGPCARLNPSAVRQASRNARAAGTPWPAAWFPTLAQNDPELLAQLKKK
jgi:hypothetical protein